MQNDLGTKKESERERARENERVTAGVGVGLNHTILHIDDEFHLQVNLLLLICNQREKKKPL